MKVKAWLRHVLLLKSTQRSEIWVLVGDQGSGKTSTANGICSELEEAGFKVCRGLPGEHSDIWFIDDAGRYFSKRFWSTKLGKTISRFLQIIRTLFTLTIITVPSLEDLDISIRESGIVEIIEVVRPGFCIWRSPIVVKPIFQNEEWRKRYIAELKDYMEESEKER